ncbi:MAG: ribosomal RNA small subunit methyltransferase A, partial [Microbacteriaceae bacterium]
QMQPNAKLRLVLSDALDLDRSHLEGQPAPTVLVANLPYNVSVPILMHLLELIPELQSGLVMVQAEVGYRIAAGPGSKEYGSPSAKAAWYGDWSIAGTVSRKIFWPVPGVDSVLVGFTKHAEPIGTEAERVTTFALVNAAFAGRRKMIRQSLQAAIPGSTTESVSELVQRAGLDPQARAESLSISDYLQITRVLV